MFFENNTNIKTVWQLFISTSHSNIYVKAKKKENNRKMWNVHVYFDTETRWSMWMRKKKRKHYNTSNNCKNVLTQQLLKQNWKRGTADSSYRVRNRNWKALNIACTHPVTFNISNGRRIAAFLKHHSENSSKLANSTLNVLECSSI